MCGDCLEELKKIDKESVDLVYIDPPFHSGKNYDCIWNNGYEQAHFDDTWYSDGQRTGMFKYIEWLEMRVRACYDVLKSNGSLYLHCDSNANAHIRLMLDRIFGEKNFRNEIVWERSTPSGGKAGGNKFVPIHDTIFFYVKTNKFIYNKLYTSYSKEYLKVFKYKDENGRKYRLQLNNRKQYLDESKGRPIGDIWSDITSLIIAIASKEKYGYPTQKPLALLERIIKASSNKNDVILDPMSGGGTTVVAAQMLNRNWIGIDISPTACRMMIKRLSDIKEDKKHNIYPVKLTEKDVIDFPIEKNELRNLSPIEFENWVRNRLHARKPKRDIGIDGITQHGANFLPPEVKRVAVQIKRKDTVSRATVEKLRGDIVIYEDEPINKKYGIIVGFGFSRDAIDRAAEFKLKYDIDIKLIDVDYLMNYEVKKGISKYVE